MTGDFSTFASSWQLLSAPSSSLMLLSTRSAIRFSASISHCMPSFWHLSESMARRVSKSGLEMSATTPDLKRERILSSRAEISSGGRSEVITICFSFKYSSLKVLKNSTWVCTRLARNCTSSTNSTSTRFMRLLNSDMVRCCMASTTSVVNFSLLENSITLSGEFRDM